MKKTAAFSLFEIILALTMLGVIVVSSLRVAKLMQYRNEVVQLRQAVDYTFILMNDFYFSNSLNLKTNPRLYNCRDARLMDPTYTNLSTLLTNASTFSSLSANQLAAMQSLPLDASLDTAFVYIQGPSPMTSVYTFYVKMSFVNPNASEVANLGGQLNGVYNSADNTITWTRLPNNTTSNTLDNDLWVASTAHQVAMSLYTDPASDPTFCPI